MYHIREIYEVGTHYRLELGGWRPLRMPEGQRETSERLLKDLMMWFDCTSSETREVLVEFWITLDTLYTCTPWLRDQIQGENLERQVQRALEDAIFFGELKISTVKEKRWDLLTLPEPKPKETPRPAIRKPLRIAPIIDEPEEEPPPEKLTWFSVQVVDESGLWVSGLPISFDAGGLKQTATTNAAGVVRLEQQKASFASAAVADIEQAKKIIEARAERLAEAPAPAGKDVTKYALHEPADRVVLSAETPQIIVLTLPPWVGISLADQDGHPVPDVAYRVVSKNGTVYNGTLDAQGKAWVGNLSNGKCNVGFPELDGKEWGGTSEDNPEGDTYTVEAGDHISGIASKAGFECDDTIWMHPKNAELRELRDNPHVLLAGDELFVPKKREIAVARAVTQTHEFVLGRTPLKLRLCVDDLCLEPFEGAELVVDSNGQASSNESTADGHIDTDVKREVKKTALNVYSLSNKGNVGALDPIDNENGQTMRLINLGYLFGPVEDSPDASAVYVAIQQLQAECGLKVSGAMDDATQAALLDLHGS